ncbi:High-affnity carbon uptake protein Hat/HatR [hydrothermal vent metagenome]|uniref:High-affnity carbon uptake protein Hat/HatR n=1 Tax=hydrothermal vent metagenome TaxID=652676 RepID=A0A1W1DX64_9ZZZZ
MNWVLSANFSPDGQTLISASADKTLKLWDLNGQCLQTFKGHSGLVLSANFSPDGQTLISASADKTLKLWGLNGQCLQTLTGFFVRSVNFSPDGQTLISVSDNNTLELCDLNGQSLQNLTGHSNLARSADGQTLTVISLDPVLSTNFSLNSQTLLSVSFDNTLKLCDLNGQCLQTLTGHSGSVLSANFSPDGQMLVSSGREICLWHKNQLQQWWIKECHISIDNNKITKIKATATAWQQLNLSNGKQTASIDDFENFELFENP